MNGWANQQKVLVGGCVTNGIVCPKPRRISIPLHFRELIRINSNNQGEGYDSKVGTELLDVILSKVPSSPPFFTVSPPNRAPNPVIQDEQFWNNHRSLLSPRVESSSSVCKSGGSVRVNFRPNLAQVRIEGFNCRGNSGISAEA